jgi:hypothetical protein
MPTIRKVLWPNSAPAICFCALLLVPGISTSQNTQNPRTQNVAAGARVKRPESSVNAPAADVAASAQGVFYADGQLRINVANSTLAEILTRVAALTGVKIELPESTSAEQVPSLKLGPGPAREVLASLLSESNFDYLIQGSDADPGRLQSLLLLPRGKRDSAPDVPARQVRNAYARVAAAPVPPAAAAAPPEEAPAAAPDTPIAAPDQAVSASLSTPPPESDQTVPVSSPPDLSAPPIYGQPLQTNVPKTFPVPPPASFDQQSVNQQLQQMYQQRMQMQQQRQVGASSPSANQ